MTFRRFLRRSFLLIFSVLCLAVIIAGFVAARGRIALASLENNADTLKGEYTPLRFMLLSRGFSSISARFFLYDADGREIASFERSWNGSDLDVETILVPVAERGLAFPVRIFADDVSTRSGTNLFSYYDRSGFPAVMESLSLDEKTRKALPAIFLGVKLFGGSVRDHRRLRDAEVGVVYALTVRFPGGVELTRN